MRFSRTVWVNLAAAGMAWLVWLLTVLGVPPDASGAQGAFYLSLLVGLTSTCALTLAALQRRRGRRARRVEFFIPHTLTASFLLLFALWRMTRRPSVPEAERTPFVAVPNTTPKAGRLDPRSGDVERQARKAAQALDTKP